MTASTLRDAVTYNQVTHVLLAASWNLAFPESVPGVGVAGGIVLCKYEGLLLGFCLCPELVGMGEHGLTQGSYPAENAQAETWQDGGPGCFGKLFLGARSRQGKDLGVCRRACM